MKYMEALWGKQFSHFMILFLWLSSDFYHWFICICGAFISLPFTLRAWMYVRWFARLFVDGVAVPIAFVCLFYFSCFFLFISCDCTQCRALATTSRVTGRFLACSKSWIIVCAFFAASIFSPAAFFLSRIHSTHSRHTTPSPLCIWILIHFSAFCDYWWVVICIACFHIISCSTSIVHIGC